MLKIMFRDNSLDRKQLSLFCLLWLISACADSICYITNLYCMTELLHELKKTAVVITEAFRHLIMFQQGKGKLIVCWTSMHNKKMKVFLRTLRILNSCVV